MGHTSVVAKTAPVPYRPRKEIDKTVRREYIRLRDGIKEKLKTDKQHSWKVTNYYLQIARLQMQRDISLGELKGQLEKEIILIAGEIHRIMV